MKTESCNKNNTDILIDTDMQSDADLRNNQIDLINLLRQKSSSMSKGHKKLASYIIENYDKAAFLTAAQLGSKAGVSESTVVRFATSLGFCGYPMLQKELADIVKQKLHTSKKIKITDNDMTQDKVIENVMMSDVEKIRHTYENIDIRAFDIAVNDIINARNVYVIGVRNSAPLAQYFVYYLNYIRKNVVFVKGDTSNELFEQMLHVSKDDVVIGISFPRYSMRTLKAMEYANNKNAHVISITDSEHSPMNMYSSCNLFARSEMASVMDSLTAAMSLINALVISMCIKCSDDMIRNLEELEKVIADYKYDGNDDINLLNENLKVELENI